MKYDGDVRLRKRDRGTKGIKSEAHRFSFKLTWKAFLVYVIYSMELNVYTVSEMSYAKSALQKSHVVK